MCNAIKTPTVYLFIPQSALTSRGQGYDRSFSAQFFQNGKKVVIAKQRVLFSGRDLVERESLSEKKNNVRVCLSIVPSCLCREESSAEK